MDLLKLFLVDDEQIILMGLEKTYDWNDMGFEIIGTACDGDQALETIKELHPDVVLTDIRMKRMSGLTLMEKTLEIFDDIHFVVVSAYREFEYAQQALKQGALAYLLKPINDEELKKTMTEVYGRCKDRISQKKTMETWRQLLLEDRDSYLHVILQRYLNNGITKEEYVHIYEDLKGDSLPEEYYVVAAVDIDLSLKVIHPAEYDAKRFVLLSELNKRLSDVYTTDRYESSEGSCVFIIHLGREKKMNALRKILAAVHDEFGGEVISAISDIYFGIDHLQKAYEQALHLFDIAMEAGAEMLMVPGKMVEGPMKAYSVDIENQIISAMRKNDEAQLKESFIKFVYQMPKSEKQQSVYLHRLIVRIEFWLQSSGEDEHIFEDEFKNLYDMFPKYQITRLVDVTYKMLLNVVIQRREKVSESTGRLFDDYVKKAQIYIEDHLADENLSISQVAGHIYLNPVYFGRVFKSVFGTSFKRFVLNSRIDRAKDLILNGNDNIAVICEKVGIPNPSYFTKLFKQVTGQLPSEYKRNHLNEE